MKYLLVALMVVLLVACDPQAEEVKAPREEILEEFSEEEKEILPIDIDEDPKKQEVLAFVRDFLISFSFPEVEGVVVRPIEDSFHFVGFTIEDSTYTTVTRFRMRTFSGTVEKQFTVTVDDLGESRYEIKNVVENY